MSISIIGINKNKELFLDIIYKAAALLKNKKGNNNNFNFGLRVVIIIMIFAAHERKDYYIKRGKLS